MQEAYRHEAVTYRGDAGFVSSCVAIADHAQAHDAQVLFLVAAARLAALRDALGDRADAVALVAIDQHGRNPARITTLLDGFQAAAHGRRCMGVNEWTLPGRSRAALAETQFAESVLNSVRLSTWKLSVTCLYDEEAAGESGLGEIRRRHPFINGMDSNDEYDADLATTTFGEPLEPAPDGLRWVDVSQIDLADTRRYVREQAAYRELSGERVEDLVFAANEVVSNSVRHGGGACQLALWSDDDSVVCEVRDHGVITDPLIGRLAPPPDAPRGRGLWLANQLCDLVQIRSSHAGTVVRMRIDHGS